MANRVVYPEELRSMLTDYTTNVDAWSRFEIYKRDFLLRLFAEWNFSSPVERVEEKPVKYNSAELTALYRRLRKNLRNRNYRARQAGRKELWLPPIPATITAASVRRLARIMGLDLSAVLPDSRTEIVVSNSAQTERILNNYNSLCSNITTFIQDSGQNFERTQKSGNKSTACFQRILYIISGSDDYLTAVNDGNTITFGDVSIDISDL